MDIILSMPVHSCALLFVCPL